MHCSQLNVYALPYTADFAIRTLFIVESPRLESQFSMQTCELPSPRAQKATHNKQIPIMPLLIENFVSQLERLQRQTDANPSPLRQEQIAALECQRFFENQTEPFQKGNFLEGFFTRQSN